MTETFSSSKVFGDNQSAVIVTSRSLDFPVQYTFYRTRKDIDLSFHRVWIELGDRPKWLDIDCENIIRINFLHTGREPSNDIQELHITDYNNPYNIMFDPAAIKDCTNLDATEATIPFTVNFQQDNDEERKTYEFEIKVSLHKAIPKQSVSFHFTDNAPEVEYKNEMLYKLGTLEVANKSSYKYAKPLSVVCSLRFDKAFEGDIAQWGDTDEIEESQPHYDLVPGLRSPGQELASSLRKDLNDDKLTLRNIVAGNTVTIPVYIDMMRIGNPKEDKLKCSFTIETDNLSSGKETIIKTPFDLMRDNTRTQMVVRLNGQEVDNGLKVNIGKFKWIKYASSQKRRFGGSSKVFTIDIANIAENEGESELSAVVVKNLTVTFDSKAESVRKAMTISGGLQDATLFNGTDSKKTIECKLSHKLVSDIPDNTASVTAHIDFDYIVDPEGTRDETTPAEHFALTASFIVETDPGNEWLCIDFGTSATAAAFGDGGKPSSLLNLDKRAEEITENVPQRMRSPRFEAGTPFLSSNTKFRQGGEQDKDAPYDSRFVWLSPTEPQFYSDSYILPYIKSLVGYNSLPDSLDYKGLTYKVGGKSANFKRKPLSIDAIFTSVYQSLFHDFILPTIAESDKSQVNKLVLTVPNTYTPRHLGYLRRIVTENFPQIRKDYIWFVSESDAIAAYYITHWYDLNASLDVDTKKQFISPGSMEHVLAFDMGAGTLDLTYFSITVNDDETREVEILAKTGLNKAGNYLDYIIAEAIIDIYHDKLPESLLHPDKDPTLLMMAGQLKHFIAHEVKPNLFTQDDIVFSDLNGEQAMIDGQQVTLSSTKIDLKAVREHSLVRQFVEECTDELVENLFLINGYQKGQTPVDNVIFTGRSVQFGEGQENGIKNRLMEAISEWNAKDTCRQIDIKGNELKTIVVDGALQFATTYSSEASVVKFLNRNIYASYGILYKNLRGQYQYTELLSPKTKATHEPNLEANSTNGVYIYQYDTDLYNSQGKKGITVDLRNSPMAYLVQTYSKDTAEDWKNNRRELISVMWELAPSTAAISSQELRNMHVRIEVDTNNEMTFTVGNVTNEPTAPMVININESNSFKKSLWPYM